MRLLAALAGVLLLAAPVSAQTQSAGAPPPARVGFSGYQDGGRRDPFVSLIAPKPAPTPAQPAPGRPATGLAALSLTDVAVTGIVRSGSTLLAILAGPDGKTFLARRQDRLADAVVKTIDAAGVVFVAQGEAAGEDGPREIRKGLRTTAVEVNR